ncbi:zinc ribbon domain-containing protein [Campylobacter jejuni]|nr:MULTISPECIES: transposase [Campylobacter]MDN2725647.1 zinc ribbon domain-containing protein [Campylobacter coli]MDP8514513.1 zinc ribbon domain-containing protein [Campylobacter coli]MDP8523060.1 zinc ribbon domain-containing protein [Campylobacter coli]MDP8554429.1 zinc ribbon domain-containing protein [Campylobacter coli]MDP8554435.1 zinc ribbon domain-containing protein [Campylobacter coli]
MQEKEEKYISLPSSKTCSCCGYIKDDLNLKDRIFECPKYNKQGI